MNQDPFERLAVDLRRAFDASFATPMESAELDEEAFVAIGVADTPYAVRLSQIRGIHAEKTLVRLPSPLPSLLGVTGIRSDVIPVYGIRSFLAHPIETEAPRWLLLAGSAETVALAFDRFEGHLRVPRANVADVRGDASTSHVRKVVALADTKRPLIDVESIVSEIRRQVAAAGLDKEP